MQNHYQSSNKKQYNVGPQRKHKPHKSKRRQIYFSAEYHCIVCGELYKHPPKEDWIQCHKCKDWSHEKCTDYNRKGFYKVTCARNLLVHSNVILPKILSLF